MMTNDEIANIAQSLMHQHPGEWSGKLSINHDAGRLVLSEYRPGDGGWRVVGTMTSNPQYIAGFCDERGLPLDRDSEHHIMRTVAKWIREAGTGKTHYAANQARDIEHAARWVQTGGNNGVR